MRRLIGIGVLAMLAGATTAHAEDVQPDYGRVCANLLHHFPTPAPLAVTVGNRVLITCQAEASGSYGPITLTLNSMSEVTWWADHAPDRPVTPGEGPND